MSNSKIKETKDHNEDLLLNFKNVVGVGTGLKKLTIYFLLKSFLVLI